MDTKNFHIDIEYRVEEDGDCIVADKEGLLKLKSAIDEALHQGEYFTDLDDFVGIKCREKNYFEEKVDYNEVSIIGNFFSVLIGLLMMVIFISGVTSVFQWFLNN